jgi:hypothetical protein
MQISNPKQIRAIDRMQKRGFAMDYVVRRSFNPVAHMSRMANGIKRYVQVTVDGMVNGRDAMAFT